MEQPIVFHKIYEHDIDLLLLEELMCSTAFAEKFLDKLPLPHDYTPVKAIHSYSDRDGESDLTILLRSPRDTVALLIENKIDAPTMEHQSQRYHNRGESGKATWGYDRFFVMLAAPAAYHKEHQTDPNADYSHRIDYEEILEYFLEKNDPRSRFKAEMLRFAIEKKRKGYVVSEDSAITCFWTELREYCTTHHPRLTLCGKDTPKGSAALWPTFRTALAGCHVVYKSDKGYVDLEFPKYAHHIGVLKKLTAHLQAPNMFFDVAGKSAVIRMRCEKIPFTQNFSLAVHKIEEVLQAVETLCSLAEHLNHSDLYPIRIEA